MCLAAWLSGNVPTEQEVLGFSTRELFHGMYGVVVSVFHCTLSMFYPVMYSGNAPAP